MHLHTCDGRTHPTPEPWPRHSAQRHLCCVTSSGSQSLKSTGLLHTLLRFPSDWKHVDSSIGCLVTHPWCWVWGESEPELSDRLIEEVGSVDGWVGGSVLNRLLLLIKSSDSFEQTFLQRTDCPVCPPLQLRHLQTQVREPGLRGLRKPHSGR